MDSADWKFILGVPTMEAPRTNADPGAHGTSSKYVIEQARTSWTTMLAHKIFEKSETEIKLTRKVKSDLQCENKPTKTRRPTFVCTFLEVTKTSACPFFKMRPKFSPARVHFLKEQCFWDQLLTSAQALLPRQPEDSSTSNSEYILSRLSTS